MSPFRLPDQFDLQDLLANGRTVTWSSDVYGTTTSRCLTEADGFNLDDEGNDGISGASSSESDSYSLSQYVSVPLAYGLSYTDYDPPYGWLGVPHTFTDFEENGIVSGSPASHSSNWEESGIVGDDPHLVINSGQLDGLPGSRGGARSGRAQRRGRRPALGDRGRLQQMTGSTGRGGFKTAGWSSATPYSIGSWSQAGVCCTRLDAVVPVCLRPRSGRRRPGLSPLPRRFDLWLHPLDQRRDRQRFAGPGSHRLGNMAQTRGEPDGVALGPAVADDGAGDPGRRRTQPHRHHPAHRRQRGVGRRREDEAVLGSSGTTPLSASSGGACRRTAPFRPKTNRPAEATRMTLLRMTSSG